uniref:Chromosome 11 open reading frame 52 n=1 Tax=Equus asinus TaxID=9793 RepID=A0A9L0J221_EQUAS
MGNRLCCGGSWSCPSAFQRQKNPDFFLSGSQARQTLKQQQQQQQQQQNGAKGHDTTGHTSKRVLGQPASQERSQSLRSEDSSLHYADIQVCSRTQPRSTREVKHLQLENATEYATLRFPQATPRYDSKNGTLV